MDKLRVADAMTEVFALFKRCNKYIDETMPWALAKDETKQDRLATVLYNLVEGICIGAVLLKSFMPETTQRILAQLNAKDRTLEELQEFGLYPNGNKVTDKPEILFARLDVNEVLERVAQLHPPVQEEAPAAEENVIDLEPKAEITLKILKSFSSRWRDHCLRGSKNPKASVLPGKNRKPGAPDRVRHQSTLFTGGNGGQKGYGRYQPETGQAGGNPE